MIRNLIDTKIEGTIVIGDIDQYVICQVIAADHLLLVFFGHEVEGAFHDLSSDIQFYGIGIDRVIAVCCVLV